MVRLLSIRSGCLDLGSQSISLVNSKITSEAGKDCGNIFIDLQLVTLNHSRITVNAILGNGGNIRLAADFLITSADSSITASSEFGLNGQISVLPQALKALEQALTVAEPLRDERAKSYALGYLAQVYEADGRHEEALRLTRKAVFSAQQANAPDAVYRWEWQSGRWRAARGETEAALAAYRRAVATLQGIRYDLALGHGNQMDAGSFRETSGALYFELADLLLRRADVEPDPVKVQDYLVEARNTIEVLRSAEMEDYFQDECVASVRRKSATIESFAAHVAVICVVPLADRVELLVNFSSGLKRYKVAVGEAELTKTAIDLRRLLEKRTTSEFLRPAQQLYRWLITPLLAELKAQQTDTLVFIPDGALRNIPMAVLHDGEAFLVSQYAVAVSPGLTLTDPKPLQRLKSSLLLNGLSKAVQGFSALDFVQSEVQTLQTNYQTKLLLDDQFKLANIEKAFEATDYSMVHIASHGQFDRDPKKSFLLAYDQKLTLDDLEKLIRPRQYRGQPVELLTLSACQTAAGDDRAALGLAGIAIKAGARSALATLWFVNDQATVTLISEFYDQMRRNPSLSKAKALQAAQLRLIQDARFRHPCYWAPYLIIGNWL